MSNWEFRCFEEICEHSAFGPRFSGELYSSDGNIATLRTTDIREDGRIDYSTMPRAQVDLSKFRNHFLRKDDLVITRSGRVGTTAVFEEYSLPVLPGAFLLRFRLKREIAEPSFYRYFFNSPQGQHLLLSTATGSAQQNLNITSLHQIKIPMPPLAEQHEIAAILGSLDDKIELNRRMNATLEATARALFKSWFVDFDPVRAKSEGRDPVGMDAETAALFPDAFEESELGPIPQGWRVTSLGDLFPNDRNCVLTGPFGSHLHAHDYRDEGVPLILVKHVNNGRIVEDDLPLVGRHKLAELTRYRLQIGDIVFTRVGAVGRSAYVDERHEGWLISGQTLRIRLNELDVLNPRYLAQVYVEDTFTKMVENYALGTTRPSLNTGLLRSFKFLLPPATVQNYFVDLVKSMDYRVASNEVESRTLAETRDALLPRLISGQVRLVEWYELDRNEN